MNRTAAFDHIATGYDASFIDTLTGWEQRLQVRRHLQVFLTGKRNLQILEINCGTGEDALWLAQMGHTVIATDQSPVMIQQAQLKNLNQSVQFVTCSIEDLEDQFAGQQFDLVFSNFAGLNCLSPEKIKTFHQQLQNLLYPDGHFAVVLFGKYTLWETCYYLLRLQVGPAFRRWTSKALQVPLTAGVHQPVWYYSTGQFKKLFPRMRLSGKKPVGMLVPPSYLEAAMQKRPRFFKWLARMDQKLIGRTALATLADHTYLLFKKNIA